MKIAGVIIAGGRGARLGGDKPLAPFRNSTLLDAVIARARPQVDQLGVNVRQEDIRRFRDQLGDAFPLIPDCEGGDIGPLAGILAALEWAGERGATMLATFPVDTPFLPTDLVKQLLDASADSWPVVVHDGDRLQGLCGIWPVQSRPRLLTAVREFRLRSLRQVLAHLGGTACLVNCTAHAFFNVNTPEDLERAERIARAAADS